MKPTLFWLAFSAALLAIPSPALHAQAAPTGPVSGLSTQVATACLPATTLEELIVALDAAISGPVGKDRACFRALMMPGATLNPIAKSPEGGYAPHVLSVDAWIEAVQKRQGEVYEHQVKIETQIYGHIAHLWSTYELSLAADQKPTIRGINSIQAVQDGKTWKVFEILWQAETPDQPLPAKYLP
jgi:hypothetical protein